MTRISASSGPPGTRAQAFSWATASATAARISYSSRSISDSISERMSTLTDASQGVGLPEVAPAVPPRAPNDNLEAFAAERLGGQPLGVGAVDGDGGAHAPPQGPVGKQGLHPPQVPFPFFADVGGEKQRGAGAQTGVAQGARQGQQRRPSR